MKKLFSLLASLAICIACAFAAAGCKDKGSAYKVFVPDGAPALAVSSIADKTRFDVTAVAANTINAYVTGSDPQADFALLPVNAAVKLLGNGENYKILGTVTHGNLFMMKKPNGADIASKADMSVLVGKTVGVINLENVPGLTFKIILNDCGLSFNELKDGAAAVADKVNLLSVKATEATPTNAACDYFVVPEPAASTKAAATGGKLSFAGSLQALYGEGGYPQAVAVVKSSVISGGSAAVEDFKRAITDSADWIKAETTSAEQIVARVNAFLREDASPTFTAQNLTKDVIANCGIAFEGNASGKAKIIEYINKINAVSVAAIAAPSDAFFI